MTGLNLIAESGAPKERLEAWREDVRRCETAWHAFGTEIGALRFYSWPFRAPNAFVFPAGQVPEGWRKPDSRGITTPMQKSTEWVERLKALPQPQPLDEICRELGLPTSLSYGIPAESSGVRSLSWTASWPAEGPVILHGEDFLETARSLSQSHGAVSFNVGGDTIPEGFTSVSAARVDYVFAKARLDEEEAARKPDDAPGPC